MSDLFAPMPLPTRPVLQTADIAEREAASKQQEIDTRMRERMETSRLQGIHEVGVVREDYRKSLQELEQAYRKTLLQPTRSYARGTGSYVRRSYQQAQQSDGNQNYYLEDGRLSTQQTKFKLDAYRLSRAVMERGLKEGLSTDEQTELFDDGMQKLVYNMRYNQSADLQAVTNKYFKSTNNLIFTMSNDFGKGLHKQEMDGIRFQIKTDARASFNEFADRYAITALGGMGLDTRLKDDPGWQEFKRDTTDMRVVIGEQIRKKGTSLYGIVRNAHIQRARRGFNIELGQRLKHFPNVSPTEHAEEALGLVFESKLWEDVAPDWNISEDQMRQIVMSDLKGAIDNHDEMVEEDKTDFLDFWLTGDFRDTPPSQFYRQAMGAGFDFDEAFDMAKFQAKSIGDQPFLLGGSATERQYEAIKTEAQTQRVANLQQMYLAHPEYWADIDARRRELRREEALGWIPQGATEDLLKKWGEPGNRVLLQSYSSVERSIRDLGNILRGDPNSATRGRASFPKMQDGERGMSVSNIVETLVEELHQMVLSPEGDVRPDVASMQDIIDVRLLSIASTMDLHWRTTDAIGVTTKFPGGVVPVRTGYQIIDAPGRETLFAGSIVEEFTDDPAVIDQFEALSPEAKPRFAVGLIDLAGYTGTETDTQSHAAMQSVLYDLVLSGHISSFELDHEEREVRVKVADRGQWVVRNLDFAAAGETLTAINQEMEEASEVLQEVQDAMVLGGASITASFELPSGRLITVPTAVVDVLMTHGQVIYNDLMDLARSIVGGTFDLNVDYRQLTRPNSQLGG